MSYFIVLSIFAVVVFAMWKLRAALHVDKVEKKSDKNIVVEVSSLPSEPAAEVLAKKPRGRPKKYGGKVKREG